MTSFNSLGLAEPLVRALAAEGYENPTPIQLQAIPPALEGNDLCGIAQTGTGKTAAFALPILHRLGANPAHRRKYSTRVLVLAPTRELASQIAESFATYGRNMKLSIVTIFGGVPIPRQERAMQPGVDIVVATPGRLLDLVDRNSMLLDSVEVLVLDEADQMLDLGFIHALRRVAQLVPRKRQTLFFSATMPKTIAELAGRFLVNPVQIAVTPVATTAERVEQQVTFVNQKEKQALLTLTLKKPEFAKTLVFTRTKHGADRVVRHLEAAGIRAAAIHGNKSQPHRERALASFKKGDIGVLVATDIAARGIDIDAVSHVINFELPNVPEQYVHRIGRTARAGMAGIALSFCADDERAYLRDIEKLTRQKVTPMPLPPGFVAAAAALAKIPVAAAPRDEEREWSGHSRAPRKPQATHRNAPRPFAAEGDRFGADRGPRPQVARDSQRPQGARDGERTGGDRSMTTAPRGDRPQGQGHSNGRGPGASSGGQRRFGNNRPTGNRTRAQG
ncbi:DEAD/DEAH box helicase [Sandaracinobacteroides saxicola]|uniref:DEAD-box ATP-dependent RNA helicase RhpA n=1 Tax=Sandaracinobacteroides saxicola TaxID=2759707 RepID=A0A7G5IFF5_9SPHN|nr:DEAD/DEAH box helicase [Sandaracinobacteroides saxicola]QMW22097.1 DEAD/DEAH box helicase [Sandaracinobacteroides saxicola]